MQSEQNGQRGDGRTGPGDGPGLSARRKGAGPIAGVGIALGNELGRDGLRDVQGLDAKGDKVQRMSVQCAKIEAGFVRCPKSASWLDTYLKEMAEFPNGKYDDQVDSTSQFLNWRRRRNISTGPGSAKIFGGKIITADGPLYGPY